MKVTEEEARGRVQKETWRTRFRTYRAALDAATYVDLSDRIAHHALHLPELATAETIHLYWPLVARREVDTRSLIRAWHAAGKRLVLPVVTQFARASGPAARLRHVVFTGEQQMTANQWGLREPTGTETVDPAACDAVIVPAFGADRQGGRIGHGFGYYDEFLADVPGPKVGLVYAACLVDRLPTEPHDVPLTHIVTENGIMRPAAA